MRPNLWLRGSTLLGAGWLLAVCAAAQGTSQSPAAAAAPAGATGICNNGVYTYSPERKGSCQGRQGIQEWFGSRSGGVPMKSAESEAPAGSSSSSANPELHQALLAEAGFNVDWVCESSRGSSRVVFREDGQKLIVDVDNRSRGTCKTEAKLTEFGVSWNGCRDPGILMVFDPANKDVPFKGKSAQCTYQFKR